MIKTHVKCDVIDIRGGREGLMLGEQPHLLVMVIVLCKSIRTAM